MHSQSFPNSPTSGKSSRSCRKIQESLQNTGSGSGTHAELLTACKSGNMFSIKRHLENSPELSVNAKTYIQEAIRHGQLEAADFLVQMLQDAETKC